ncbi:NADase-type glycan-binding domain-containing protein [[Pseudopropionibacterium] massiliense]|uniref:NADase-type glycan-binding domain-containing protein n=1 Tax=[Pseudopropionibacterium] massiliense TaxID=2220000 RepID=UPI0013EF3670|nr:hypothetical protein [[Pseudopropionibacterium] massiliense]
MSKRLPDEYFRQTISESSDVRSTASGEGPWVSPGGSGRRPRWVSLRLVIASCVAAALVGVMGTRLAMQPESETSSPTPSPSITSVLDLTPYDGAATPVAAYRATGECSQDGQDRAAALVDARADTIWRCPGGGVGETITFGFPPGTELVGVRIVNGDATGDAYRTGRRIMAVRWTFSDGSWTVQPLDISHPEYQEVRFPPVVTEDVLMTVLSTTEPGGPGTDADAVAVSRVEFLGRG